MTAGALADNLLALYRMTTDDRAALGAKARKPLLPRPHYRRSLNCCAALESFTLQGEYSQNTRYPLLDKKILVIDPLL